jgi:KDO2-lipid IV(A) lauroyltransferase
VRAILRLLSRILSGLSESSMRRMAATIGALWWGVLRYRRQVIEENLARAFPERSVEDRAELGKAACTHLVTTLAEFLRLPKYAAGGFERMVRFEGIEHYHGAKAKGRGILCLSGHLGSFELGISAVVSQVSPVSLVVKHFPGGVDAFFTELRESQGLKLISADHALRPILRALKDNESVIFVLDQNATRKIGVFVDFFGKTACTMSALAVLALRTGAPVVPATVHREPDGTHFVRIHPEIPLEEQSSREETVVHMTQVYTRFLERVIREHPEQWFWMHKRWRTQPKRLPAQSAIER